MESTAKDTLRNHGLRPTPIREKVWELFNNASKALPNKELEMQFENIDRITLYRTLKAFEEKGLIHKIDDGTGVPKYASCHDDCADGHHQHEHVHFHCLNCLSTTCLEDVQFPKIDIPPGYLTENTSIVVNGRCANCQN